MLSVAATCAGAGIIVGVVTLTGLGLKFSSIVLDYAGNSLLLTAIYTSLIVWIVGLAVPVTASYIICAVIAAPALIKLGVPDFAAHMFIFYYAVLSEVSPPTALSPFAAAAITGGDPYKTTLQSWKYTMPAFLVPFMFVLDPSGTGLLLTGSIKTLGDADWGSIALVTFTAAIGIAALAGGLQGWLFKRTTWIERWMLIIAGLALVYPSALFDAIGIESALHVTADAVGDFNLGSGRRRSDPPGHASRQPRTLQRPEAAGQPENRVRRCEHHGHVRDTAAIGELFAKAAAGPRVDGHVRGVARVTVIGIPPVTHRDERFPRRLRCCVHGDVVRDQEPRWSQIRDVGQARRPRRTRSQPILRHIGA